MYSMKTLYRRISGPFVTLFAVAVIIVTVLSVLVARRAAVFARYDSTYWKDRYEHSQYQLPLSSRIIGDDGLYAYAGYRLAAGDDPFSINVDKPPVGKYLLGFAAYTAGTPVVASVVFAIGTLVVFFLFSRGVGLTAVQSAVATALLATDAMWYTQLASTALDVFQLFFLLGSLAAFVYWYRNGSLLLVGISGIALGLFAETKPPITLPVVLLVYAWWALRCGQGIRKVSIPAIVFGIGAAAGVVMPYARYLQLGHSFIDIIRIHRFMIAFYQASTLETHVGAILTVLFTGMFPNITSGELLHVSEWSPVWPGVFAAAAASLIVRIRGKKRGMNTPLITGTTYIALGSLAIYVFIPAYPRYLLTVVPFLYISAVWLISALLPKRFWYLLVVVSLIGLYVRAAVALRPDISSLRSVCAYSMTHGYFRDVYEECLDASSKQEISRVQFDAVVASAMRQAEIMDIAITDRGVSLDSATGTLYWDVTYHMQHLGSYTRRLTVPVTLERGQWKIVWQWDMVFPGFVPGAVFISDITYGKRGTLYDAATNRRLAYDGPGYLVSVDPSGMDVSLEDEMLVLLEEISGIPALDMQNRYLENPVPGEAVPLFSLFVPLTADMRMQLASYPGVDIVPYRSRIYTGSIGSGDIANTGYTERGSRIYSATWYHGVAGPEKVYDADLSGRDGGQLRLLLPTGASRVLVSEAPVDGRDIHVTGVNTVTVLE